MYDQGGQNLGAYTFKLNPLSTGTAPHNTIGKALYIAVGSTATDSISTSTEVDMFRFTASAGQTISFDVNKTAGSTLDGYLSIFDSGGYYVAYNGQGAAPGETVGTDPYIEVTFTTAGTYYVGISGEPNDSYSAVTGAGVKSGSTGGYTLTLSDVGLQDPNDQLTEASNIAVGGSVSDTINTHTDVDVYRFTASAGQTISFNVNTNGSGLDAYLAVVDSGGLLCRLQRRGAAPGEVAGTDPYVEVTFTTAGTYYAIMSGEPNDSYNVHTGGGDKYGSMGAYTLILSDVGTQDPNDQLTEASNIVVGGSLSDTINTPTDVDVFRFTAAANQTISFNVNTNGSGLDAYLAVVDSGGYYVAYNGAGAAPGEIAGTDPYVEVTFTTAGTYYVIMSGEPNDSYNVHTGGGDKYGSMGAYTLILSDVVVQDPDDQLTEARGIGAGSTVSDSISTPTDVDVYTFNAVAGQTLTFNVVRTSGNLNPYMEVLDSGGYYVSYTSSSNLKVTFTTTGKYYVVISDQANDNYNVHTGGSDHYGNTGGYTLSLF